MIPLWLQFLVATIVVFGSMVAWVYGEKLYFTKKYSGTPSPMPLKEKSEVYGSSLYRTQEGYNRYESGGYQGGDL